MCLCVCMLRRGPLRLMTIPWCGNVTVIGGAADYTCEFFAFLFIPKEGLSTPCTTHFSRRRKTEL